MHAIKCSCTFLVSLRFPIAKYDQTFNICYFIIHNLINKDDLWTLKLKTEQICNLY